MRRGEHSDEELINLIAHRDSDALRALYQRYGRMVFGLAMQVTGNAGSAEEICQDVFMRVWEKSGTYQSDKAKVVTWLARIARNRAIDVLRFRRSRGLDLPQSGDEPPAPNETGGAQSAYGGAQSAYGGADPSDQLWQSFREQEVREAVAALPRDQRQALSLAFFKGFTHREIAQALGEPLGTVKTRIRDAMVKLRSSLGKGEGP
jgi:RNA polymerase sigma-70 factor (ECF subfamily)